MRVGSLPIISNVAYRRGWYTRADLPFLFFMALMSLPPGAGIFTLVCWAFDDQTRPFTWGAPGWLGCIGTCVAVILCLLWLFRPWVKLSERIG
jgi:hypothetical protein